MEVKAQKKEPESLSTKFESTKEEYNITIGNLMNAKKELKNIKENIQKSSGEYADIVSKIKLSRADLLKINNEHQEKTNKTEKTDEEYKKQNLLTQEINNSEELRL